MLTEEILEEFDLIKGQQFLLFEHYESMKSFEMAYLSLWNFLERTIKLIYAEIRKRELFKEICEWKNYLEGVRQGRPREIKNFTIESRNRIPDIKTIERYLGNLIIITQIFNTDNKRGSTKWRDKRNKIAHYAESFAHEKTYSDYKNKILDGISELELAIENFFKSEKKF